jgi:hypothetical protein
MPMRERRGGNLLWMQSTVLLGLVSSLDPFGFRGVGLWKNIRKGWSLFRSHTRLILGNGSRI